MASLGANQPSLTNDQYQVLIQLLSSCNSDQRRRVEGMITILDIQATNATENRIVTRQDVDAARRDLSGTSVVTNSNSTDTVMNDDSNNTSINNEPLDNRAELIEDSTRSHMDGSPDSGTIIQMTPASATTNPSVVTPEKTPENNLGQGAEDDDLDDMFNLPLDAATDAIFLDLVANPGNIDNLDHIIDAPTGATAPATGELTRLKKKYKLPEYSNVAPEIEATGYTIGDLPPYAVVLGKLECGKLDERLALATKAYGTIRKSCQGFPADKRILCYKLLCHLHANKHKYNHNGWIPTHVNQLLFVRFDTEKEKYLSSKIDRLRERSVNEEGSDGEFVANLYIYVQLKRRDLDGEWTAEPIKICWRSGNH